MEFTFTFQLDCKHEYCYGDYFGPFRENEFLRNVLQGVLDNAESLKKYKIKVSNLVAKPREDSGRIWEKPDTEAKGSVTRKVQKVIDDLGRIHIPRDLRTATGLMPYDKIELIALKEGSEYSLLIRRAKETESKDE